MLITTLAEEYSPHNVWLTIGGVLLALEVAGASGFLLWSGISALLIGLLVWIVPISWEWQGATFAILTVGLAWLWWYVIFNYNCVHQTLMLNQRGHQLIGLRTYLSEPVINGFGRLRIGDTTWRIQANEDLPKGVLVEVCTLEGITLHVMRISLNNYL